jgi:hypothetical protein
MSAEEVREKDLYLMGLYEQDAHSTKDPLAIENYRSMLHVK